MSGTPIYIHSGVDDPVIAPSFQEEQRDFYESYGADVSFNSAEGIGHWYTPTTFRDGLEYIYADMYGSAHTTLAADDENWATNGKLLKFNQDEFGPTDGFDSEGFFYYPNSCVGSAEKCKVAFIFTGGGNW